MRNKEVVQSAIVRKAFNELPEFIPRTDEERIQDCYVEMSRRLDKNDRLIVFEKIDGEYSTYALYKAPVKTSNFPVRFIREKLNEYYINKYGFEFKYIVCSRNKVVDKHLKGHKYIENSEKYNMEELLRDLVAHHPVTNNIVIRGEGIGSNIRGNKYNLPRGEHELYVYDIWLDGVRQDYETRAIMLINSSERRYARIPMTAPYVDLIKMPDSSEDVIKFVDNMPSKINEDVIMEGCVFRNYDKDVSFKAVSETWKLKYDE